MHFMLAGAWHCQFLEPDLKTPAGRPRRFASSDLVIEMAQRGGASLRLEDRQALEYGIQLGRGSVWLNLTVEQYAKLK
jgi:hypothetical protein